MAAEEFVTQLLQLGVGGVDLKRSVDLVQPIRLARMTNLARDEEGRLTTRPGQRRLLWTPGTRVHSLSRLQAALAGGEFVRFAGVGSKLYAGREGALEEIASGFSGQPLAFVPGRPPLSGDSWLYVGDSAKMVKVRASDRLVLPVGLPQPSAPCVASLGSDNRQLVPAFDFATGWVGNAGTGGAPAVAADPDAKFGPASIAFTSALGSATAGYYNFWGTPIAVNLSQLEGIAGIVPATDDDQVHLWMKMDKPGYIDEVRVYFVVSPDFSASVLPGTSETANTNAYVKSFTPSAFTPLVEAGEQASQALEEAVSARQLVELLEEQVAREGGAAIAAQQADETRAAATSRLALGRGQWTEFGSVGVPLRRGEFLRIGSDINYGWPTLSGIIVYLKTSAAEVVVLKLDDVYMRGGYKPDTSEPTSTGYDYRYRNYDPRTGVAGRLSPEMAADDKVDVVRQSLRVRPQAYGDPAIRQQFFRRGGTLPSNWYFVGMNRSDGGCGTDNTSDAEASAAGPITDTDYHQPVSTVDRDGAAVYAQPLPVIFGPAQGMLFGLGDPHRPGHVYWTLPDEYDHWPLANNVEVCSPEDELMNGGVFGGQAFAFSHVMLYNLLISVVDGRVKAIPSACAKGLAARSGLAVGVDGVYFVATDGIWRTTGGTPQNLTDDFIEPLFRGIRKNGYAPVDWLAASEIRLHHFQNELWFLFQDVDGERQVWVYSLVFQFWRHYAFNYAIASLVAEEYELPRLLLGQADGGRVYAHEGHHDDGLAISPVLRTGALNQGMPRSDKLYGDLELEMDLYGAPATVTTYRDKESSVVSVKTVVPLAGPQLYLVDAFSTPLLAKDVSLEVSWTAPLTAAPWIGRGGPSFVPQPETSIGRLTEWNDLAGTGIKLVKGVLIEANTFGVPKTLQVMKDGGTTPAATFTFQTAGRQLVHQAFSSQLEARLVRLVPADTSPWTVYQVRWIFDVDPLELTRWETQPTDHGIHTMQTLGEAYVTTRSTTEVLLTVTAYSPSGAVIATGSITIPATGGAKVKNYVKLPTLKGALFTYLFTSSVAHRLYREESKVDVWPWGAEAPVPVQPFGTDDLDVVRIVGDAEGAAGKASRWLDTSVKAGET